MLGKWPLLCLALKAKLPGRLEQPTTFTIPKMHDCDESSEPQEKFAGAVQGKSQADAAQVCPNRSPRLQARSCKLLCAVRGFYLSFSDFY